MPYSIKKVGSHFAIVRKTDGKVVGRSTSKKKAAASIRARMAAESQ